MIPPSGRNAGPNLLNKDTFIHSLFVNFCSNSLKILKGNLNCLISLKLESNINMAYVLKKV